MLSAKQTILTISLLLMAGAVRAELGPHAQQKPNEPGHANSATAAPAVFPCDYEIAKLENPPRIVIHGEVHNTESAKKHDEELLGKVKAGKCLMLREGLFCGREGALQRERLDQLSSREKTAERDLAFGFDDPFTYGFSGLLAAFAGVKHVTDQPAQRDARDTVIKDLVSNESSREAWDLMVKTHSPAELEKADPNEKAIVDFLQGIRNSTGEDVKDVLKQLSAKHIFIVDSHALESVLKKWIRAYTTLATNKYKKSKFVPESLEANVKNFLDTTDPKTAYYQVAVDWRNQFLAANIAKEYCDNLIHEKQLDVTVGWQHMDGLAEILGKMGAGKVPVEKSEVKGPELEKLKEERKAQLNETQRLLDILERLNPPIEKTGEK